jgi:hypothetical protein
MRHPHDPSHGHGLALDLAALNATLLKRRRALGWLAGAGASALPLISCGGGGSSDDATTLAATTTGSIATTSTTGTTTSTTTTSTSETCAVIPTETNGPYPADGTTALNALLLSGIVRSDIRSSFAGATGVAITGSVSAGYALALTVGISA